MRLITFDTDPDLLMLPEVRILLASSWIGKPGMDVPNIPFSGVSNTGVCAPFREGVLSYSVMKDGASDTTGVKETKGGATLAGITFRDPGLSAMELRVEKVACEVCWVVISEGRLGSFTVPLGCVGAPVLLTTAVATPAAPAPADATADKGAARLFFIRENKEVTKVYEDKSFSSSSEKGLNEVRHATSLNFVGLLLETDEGVMELCMGGDSIESREKWYGLSVGRSVGLALRAYRYIRPRALRVPLSLVSPRIIFITTFVTP
jgi:hypothetical protein